jgi:hypothetical protein
MIITIYVRVAIYVRRRPQDSAGQGDQRAVGSSRTQHSTGRSDTAAELQQNGIGSRNGGNINVADFMADTREVQTLTHVIQMICNRLYTVHEAR